MRYTALHSSNHGLALVIDAGGSSRQLKCLLLAPYAHTEPEIDISHPALPSSAQAFFVGLPPRSPRELAKMCEAFQVLHPGFVSIEHSSYCMSSLALLIGENCVD